MRRRRGVVVGAQNHPACCADTPPQERRGKKRRTSLDPLALRAHELWEQIEQLINQDRKTWSDRAHGLHDSAVASLKAIEAKDAEALLNSGDGIDQACEKCHLVYWYPEEAKRLKEAEQTLKK